MAQHVDPRKRVTNGDHRLNPLLDPGLWLLLRFSTLRSQAHYLGNYRTHYSKSFFLTMKRDRQSMNMAQAITNLETPPQWPMFNIDNLPGIFNQ